MLDIVSTALILSFDNETIISYRQSCDNSIDDNDPIKPPKPERLTGGEEMQQEIAAYQYIHVHIAAKYVRPPIVPAPHTFRSSFERAANPKYGRSASGAERPFVISSSLDSLKTCIQARPERTPCHAAQSYYSTTYVLYSRIFPLYCTPCKLQRTSVNGVIDRGCFLFCYI